MLFCDLQLKVSEVQVQNLNMNIDKIYAGSHCIEDGGSNLCDGNVVWIIFTNIYNRLQEIYNNYNQN